MAGPPPLFADLKARIDKKVQRKTLNTQLGLENLKRHSSQNKITGNTLNNSSVKSGSVEDSRLNGGKPTLIPFLYEGRIVGVKEAIDRAVESKTVFPAFDNNDDATAASIKLSSRLGRKKK